MKRFILGFILGIVASFIFVYFGGGRQIEDLGRRTRQVEEKIKNEVKQTIEKAREVGNDTKKIGE